MFNKSFVCEAFNTLSYKQHFDKQRQAETGKKSSKAEPELLLFENYSYSSSTYHPKVEGHILKYKQKNKYVCILEIIRLIIMIMKIKMKK